MFPIENGVPFSSNRGGRGRKPTHFPFHDMEIGQSFLIPCDPTDKKVMDSWRRKVLVAKKRFNADYADEAAWDFRTGTEVGGLRVWRIELAPKAAKAL
jgi:hypothetical protein